MRIVPVFNRNHDFTFLDREKLFKPVELEPVLHLFIDIESLKDGTTVILDTKTNILAESVLSKWIKLFLENLLIRSFHGDHEWFLMNLWIIMVIQESTPHFRIVSLQIRLNLYVCVSWLTAQTIWLDINLPLRWRWFTYVLLRLISVHLLIVY